MERYLPDAGALRRKIEAGADSLMASAGRGVRHGCLMFGMPSAATLRWHTPLS
jgi:hypothetical protein